METFTKVLSKTDIKKRLAVPTNYLQSLPSLNGDCSVDFKAIDAKGKVWTFKCSIRKKGHPKPVISKGWLAFVGSKKLKAGYKIRFYKESNKVSTATHVFRVQAEKEIKIFGAVLGYAPI